MPVVPEFPAIDPPVTELVTDHAMSSDIAEVAALTFPLACPPHATRAMIDAFIRDNLTADDFARHITDPVSDVVVVRDGQGGASIGYCLVHHRAPTHPDVVAVVTERPVSEISKMYVLPDHHSRPGTPSAARSLMEHAIAICGARGSILVWLGVNQENVRAQRFYTKLGFSRAGEKTFDLAGSVEHDLILTRPLI